MVYVYAVTDPGDGEGGIGEALKLVAKLPVQSAQVAEREWRKTLEDEYRESGATEPLAAEYRCVVESAIEPVYGVTSETRVRPRQRRPA